MIIHPVHSLLNISIKATKRMQYCNSRAGIMCYHLRHNSFSKDRAVHLERCMQCSMLKHTLYNKVETWQLPLLWFYTICTGISCGIIDILFFQRVDTAKALQQCHFLLLWSKQWLTMRLLMLVVLINNHVNFVTSVVIVVVITLFPTKIHENTHMYNTSTVVCPQNVCMYFVSDCQKKLRLIELAAATCYLQFCRATARPGPDKMTHWHPGGRFKESFSSNGFHNI